MTDAIPLTVEHLTVRLGRRAEVLALSDVTATLTPGEVTAIVGSSGSGKSTLARTASSALPRGARAEGRIIADGADLLALPRRSSRHLRGTVVAMAFQDAQAALNPVRQLASLFREAASAHGRSSGWRERADASLARVGLDDSGYLDAYPFELSGGQCQRAALALSLSLEPRILLADEITSALDVITQEEIASLLDELRRERALTVGLITHDLGLAARLASRIVVLDAGRVVEEGAAEVVLERPSHERTRALLDSRLHLEDTLLAAAAPSSSNSTRGIALEAADTIQTYQGQRARRVTALDRVSLRVQTGEAVALVGGSGAGKSTLLRCLAALERPTSGRILWWNKDVTGMSRNELRLLRRRVQLVFQNPLAALDPKRRVADIVREPIDNFPDTGQGDPRRRVLALLDEVGLGPELADRRPAELSGGQQQRVAIARALAPNPEVLLLDEPLASLDAELRGRIVRLLSELRLRRGLTLLFVTHDLAPVPLLCERVVIMDDGRIVDDLPVCDLPTARHPATRRLVDAAIGKPQPARAALAHPPTPLEDAPRLR